MRTWIRFAILALCSACSSAAPLSRVPDPRDAVSTVPKTLAPQLYEQAHAVFETRCVVCHGCYDAPCQLKLGSFAGLERGATNTPVYDSTRLVAAEPTRLDTDAHFVSEWRAKGFHNVIPEAGRTQSVLLRMLDLKRDQPLTREVDYDSTFSLGLDREAQCVESDNFEAYASEHPLWGMPYALPSIEADKHAAVRAWIEAGAPNGVIAQPSAAAMKAMADWESYLNEPSLKRQLIARYLYEHLFLGSLYFRDVNETEFFRIVRSRTPPGFAVDEIPTRRPFDDPGQERFYYRFALREETRLAKTHMPYALDAARLARFRELFDARDFSVEKLPSYEPHVASNPFRAFAALPVDARYRFLLDEAQYFMMGFIKGPVCRGQVALNVIQERFWVAFLDPSITTGLDQTLTKLQMHFDLPAESGSTAAPLAWFAEARQHGQYVAARNALWSKLPLNLELVWNGEGHNSNAGLTVFRHFDSATVVKGFVGGPPKTAWIVDYPMFERIHYLLVAGFDVFGNLGHQIMTRLYMDFLRMEGEANYLLLLPRARRSDLAEFWYRGLSDDQWDRVHDELTGLMSEPQLHYATARPELELDKLLQQRLTKVLAHDYERADAETDMKHLRALEALHGPAASAMPELSFIAVEGKPGEVRYYTLMRDSAHTNVVELFDEENRRVVEEDELRIVPGFIGAYPNALFKVRETDLELFVKSVAALQGNKEYRALRERFGVLRHSPEFWVFSDHMNQTYRAQKPLESGLFDYNRLQAP